MSGLNDKQQYQFNQKLAELKTIQSRMKGSLSSKSREYQLVCTNIDNLVQIFAELDTKKINDNECGPLIRSLVNCVSILKSIELEKSDFANKRINCDTEFAQLEQDLPVLIKSSNPEVRDSGFGMCGVITAIAFIVLVLAPIALDVFAVCMGADPVCTMAFCSFMWPSDLFSSTTPTPVEVNSTRDAGNAMKQFKDQMVDYKNQQSNDHPAQSGVVETSSVERKLT